MPTTFAKAPLVEIIAELRWVPQGSTPAEPVVPEQAITQTIFLGGTKQEEFYIRLGDALHQDDFNRSERMIPPGMPFVLQQPVYRFRSAASDKMSVIYQVGYGIFSVHGIPPYHSWSKFMPFVERGFDRLIQCRPEADKAEAFNQGSLRYIDFFGEQLTRGKGIQEFTSGVLGVSTSFPKSVMKNAISDEVRNLFAKLVLPTKFGELNVSVGDGQFDNQPGVLLDSTGSFTNVAPELRKILEKFDLAYNVLHELFFEMTRPLHEFMGPQ